MLANPLRKDEQTKLIIECRQSGLTDYEWCNQHGIKPGPFYNWVKRLKKSDGRSFPRSNYNALPKPKQEVVKLDLSTLERPTSIINDQYNNSAVMNYAESMQEPVMQINVSGFSTTNLNGTNPRLLETAIKTFEACMLGGISIKSHVYIVADYTDMRRSIDGLCAIVYEQMKTEIDNCNLYLFCGKRCDRIKAIFREPDGIVLLYKRLDPNISGRFRWPRIANEVKTITWKQFERLIEGLEIEQPKALKKLL